MDLRIAMDIVLFPDIEVTSESTVSPLYQWSSHPGSRLKAHFLFIAIGLRPH